MLALIEARWIRCKSRKRIRGRVKQQMRRVSASYYLNEQMKGDQKELGDLEDGQ